MYFLLCWPLYKSDHTPIIYSSGGIISIGLSYSQQATRMGWNLVIPIQNLLQSELVGRQLVLSALLHSSWHLSCSLLHVSQDVSVSVSPMRDTH